MFNFSTPVSPLSSTPVASPSHEPSKDGISRIEKSMVSLEFLRNPPKIAVKKVDSIIQRRPRSRERRPRDPRRSYPRVFRRPLMHIDSPRNMPKFFSTLKVWPCCVSETMVSRPPKVSCLVCLGSRFPNKRFKYLHYLNVGTIL
ncbi:hypothetical protein TNCV_4752081 [Trichonephila clavipes]|nr:hypothetical protein TNCV_4752081 [Trichonephila clavipes]